MSLQSFAETVRKLTGKIINLLALLLEDSRQGELPRAEFTRLNQQLHNIGLKPFVTNTTFVFRTCIRKRLRENGMYSECSLQHIQNYIHAIYSRLCTVPFLYFQAPTTIVCYFSVESIIFFAVTIFSVVVKNKRLSFLGAHL